MRDKVNVSIDHKLKQMYEDLKEIHSKSWTEWFEEATIDFLMKIDPVQTLEYVIKQEDEKQQERKIALIRAKANIEALKIHSEDKEEEKKEREIQLQKLRLEKFENEFKSIEKQWSNGLLNWTRIIDFGEFKNIKDAKQWLEKELKARGIMKKYVHYN